MCCFGFQVSSKTGAAEEMERRRDGETERHGGTIFSGRDRGYAALREQLLCFFCLGVDAESEFLGAFDL